MKQSDSENIPEQEDIPSLEDVEEELGFGPMDFFSSMVSPEPREGETRWPMMRRLRSGDEC
jgi:hypothetical protein